MIPATTTDNPGAARRRTGWARLGRARVGRARFGRIGAVGLGVLVLIALLALLAPVLPLADPLAQLAAPLHGPSIHHWLGTDELGRDIASRIVYGYQLSLFVAVVTALAAGVLGVGVGLVAGYFGGWLDATLMRLMDLLLSVPATLLAVVLVAVFGGGVIPLVVAISLIGLPPFARLTRASVLTVREREYVVAARAAGAPTHDLILRTILPNVLGPASVQLVVTGAVAVLTESGLSFLGLGTAPPRPALGEMLANANNHIYEAPGYTVIVGLSIVLMVAAFDALGAGLQRRFGSTAARGGVVA